MAVLHFTLPTRFVKPTAQFLEQTLGYPRVMTPDNSPVEVVWLDAGGGVLLHVFFAEGFAVSPFEGEFGRHVAVSYSHAEFPELRKRLVEHGAELAAPIRHTASDRFFFREPVNGYVFEVSASHFDQ